MLFPLGGELEVMPTQKNLQLQKDDASTQSKIAYYSLLFLFFFLVVFGVVNLLLVFKIKKLSKQVATFYFVSQTLVLFRVLLFADPLIDWTDYTYVIVFITMPSYLYLCVGLSQVMLTVESIMKIQNHKVRSLEEHNFKQKLARNKLILDICYYILWAIIISMVVTFGYKEGVCVVKQNCIFEHTYMWPMPLAVTVVIVWIVLAFTTCIFVIMLHRRYSDSSFASPRRKLIGFLSVFSLSFFVRGTWDFIISSAIHLQDETSMAILIFFVYFVTEWVPIFVIFLYHFWAFYQHYRIMKRNLSEKD